MDHPCKKGNRTVKFRSKLFGQKPYHRQATRELFCKAMQENFRFQYEHCKAYQKIADEFGMKPEDILTEEDVAKIPPLPTLLFKHHHLYSMRKSQMLIKATSSGTKGKYSRIGFELSSLLCGLKMVIKIGKLRNLFSYMPSHYMVLGYKPHRSNQTAVTKTAFGVTLFAPALSRTYILKYKGGKYEPDFDGMKRALLKYSKTIFPVRFIGFPSYTYFLLKQLEEEGVRLKLRKGSKVMLGGGWKQFYTQQVDKQELYELVERILGIKDCDIAEFFGAVEHPILYCDCERHHFHVPVYSEVLIRDVNTLKPVPMGTTGLVNLLTPMVKATPILSVMTDDLGVLHEGKECGCGIDAPYLEVIGRVGVQDIKTCAAGAAEMLSGVKG